MSQIPLSSIENHDNTEQAQIYPVKLKHIVSGRQSAIIAGLNKCKILTGTNASNGSRTRGYIFLLCSPPLVGMYWCCSPAISPPLFLARPPRTPRGGRSATTTLLLGPHGCTSPERTRLDVSEGGKKITHHIRLDDLKKDKRKKKC